MEYMYKARLDKTMEKFTKQGILDDLDALLVSYEFFIALRAELGLFDVWELNYNNKHIIPVKTLSGRVILPYIDFKKIS